MTCVDTFGLWERIKREALMSEKLQKVLARAGLGSRREMESWIEAGRVRVNDVIAQLGLRVEDTAQISVDGKPLLQEQTAKTSTLPAVLMYHKPEGEVCTRSDPEGRPTVFDHLPNPPSGRWIIVGRLDFNTSGLLLFTNDGELANKLMHPSNHLQRVYSVRVYGNITEALLNKLQQGVMLEDGEAHFDKIKKMTGLGANNWYEVSVAMGRNRIVRRLWESQGIRINRLIRTQFGPIPLPKTLQPKRFTLLSSAMVESLM